MSRFDRADLAGHTLAAARALIGADLVADDGRRGRIVELEAYIGEDDRACHARFGRTARNSVMYEGPGLAYVYLVYGMYHCLNVVTEPAGRPAAILIRALEPLDGVDAMRAARLADVHRRRHDRAAVEREARRLERLPEARLAAGPGLIGACLGLTVEDTGRDLCAPGASLRIETAAGEPRAPVIAAGPRIGIEYAGEPWVSMPWRFVDASSPALSRPPGSIGDR